MEKYFLFFDSSAKSNDGQEEADCLEVVLDHFVGKADIARVTNYSAFLSDKKEYSLIICGGQDNLSRFVNGIMGLDVLNPVYYFTFEENDFWKEFGSPDHILPILVTDLLTGLPICEVNSKRYVLLSHMGFGLDSRFAELYEAMIGKENKRRHTWLRICRELWQHYRPVNVNVTKDGISRAYGKVWMASVVHGEYYGGVKLPETENNDFAGDRSLSIMILHGCGRWKAIWIFWEIFYRKRLKHSKHLEILTGKEITVLSEYFCTVLMDGQIQKNVKQYSVYAAKTIKRK